MDNKYNVGDIVTIFIHPLFSKSDLHAFGFVFDMQEMNGRKFKITQVDPTSSCCNDVTKKYFDNHRYYLEGNDFAWSSSMFKETYEI